MSFKKLIKGLVGLALVSTNYSSPLSMSNNIPIQNTNTEEKAEITAKDNSRNLYEIVIKDNAQGPLGYGIVNFGSKVVNIEDTRYHILAFSESDGNKKLRVEILRDNKLKTLVDKLADGTVDEAYCGEKTGTTSNYIGRTDEYNLVVFDNPELFNEEFRSHVKQILGHINR